MRTCKGILLILLLMSTTFIGVCFADDGCSKKIKVNVERSNVIIKNSTDKEVAFEYDNGYYKVKKEFDNENMVITCERNTDKLVPWDEKIIIGIPNGMNYEELVVNNSCSAVTIEQLDYDTSLISDSGANGLRVDSSSEKKLYYRGEKSSCGLSIDEKLVDYTLSVKKEKSSYSIPLEITKVVESEEHYIMGSGERKMNIELKDSSFAVRIKKNK